jgi:hypothetical protein
VDLIRPSLNVHSEPIEDLCGPSATMPDLNVKFDLIEIIIYFNYLVFDCYE